MQEQSSLQFNKFTSLRKPADQINLTDYQPLKIGLHYIPPTIMIEYVVPSTGKLFHHKIRLEKMFRKQKPIEKILQFIRWWHKDYLLSYKDDLLKSFIIQLKEKFSEYLRKNSGQIENSCNCRALQSDQIQFTNQDQNKANKASNNNNLKQDNLSINKSDILINQCFITPNFNSKPLILDPEQEDRDLNKLTTEELNKEKAKMDEMFSKNQKKPGDEEFVYDLQVDFIPFEDNEWDQDEEG